jgi:hypothetical protein
VLGAGDPEFGCQPIAAPDLHVSGTNTSCKTTHRRRLAGPSRNHDMNSQWPGVDSCGWAKWRPRCDGEREPASSPGPALGLGRGRVGRPVSWPVRALAALLQYIMPASRRGPSSARRPLTSSGQTRRAQTTLRAALVNSPGTLPPKDRRDRIPPCAVISSVHGAPFCADAACGRPRVGGCSARAEWPHRRLDDGSASAQALPDWISRR